MKGGAKQMVRLVYRRSFTSSINNEEEISKVNRLVEAPRLDCRGASFFICKILDFKLNHVAVFDDVGFAFGADEAALAGGGVGAGG